jgi:hypothetical protein
MIIDHAVRLLVEYGAKLGNRRKGNNKKKRIVDSAREVDCQILERHDGTVVQAIQSAPAVDCRVMGRQKKQATINCCIGHSTNRRKENENDR